jgi:hypothetical protein
VIPVETLPLLFEHPLSLSTPACWQLQAMYFP